MDELQERIDPATTDSSNALAYFFIPLPEAVSLPHGWISKFLITDQGELENGESTTNELFRVGPMEKLTASLAVHQLREEPALTSVNTALRAAASAFHWDSIDSEDRHPKVPRSVARSVVEVMVPIRDATEPSLQKAFDHAVECCERLLRIYYGATQHAVSPVTRSRLPPAIPFAVRYAQLGESEPRWPPREDARLLVNVSSHLVAVDPPPLTKSKVDEVAMAGRLPPRGPFAGLLDVRRELALAQRAGNTIPLAILCGASAEVLFRELLLVLLWEEGRQPVWAATKTSKSSISSVVHSEMPRRIGGDWSRSSTGVIAAWARDIAELRDRAVHVGFVPTQPQIAKALKTYERVERFVGDRLAASLNDYPLTASTFLGNAGLERRKASQRLKRRLETGAHPVDVPTSFERWRREVDRHAGNGPWIGEATGAAAMLVIYVDHREQWWLMDERTGLCCLARPVETNENQSENLERLRADLRDSSTTSHVSLRVQGKALALEPTPAWVPISEAIPSNEYSRFPLSLLPPPTASLPTG